MMMKLTAHSKFGGGFSIAMKSLALGIGLMICWASPAIGQPEDDLIEPGFEDEIVPDADERDQEREEVRDRRDATEGGLPSTATSPGEPPEVTWEGASKSLVWVTVTAQRPKINQPWEKHPPTRRRGLGVILEGGRVLVTAELVADATYIELENPIVGNRSVSTVDVVDYECNLALLKAQAGGEFFEGRAPLEIDEGAVVGDDMETWQLQDNGAGVVTRGRLSRIEVGNLFIPGKQFLTYEMKGPLQNESGSFIVPAIRDGRLAGIVLSYDSDNQLAKILPAPVINRFLEDLEGDDYRGFPSAGIVYARTVDPQFRRFLGLEDDEGGVFVSKVGSHGSAAKAGIEEGDVILEFAGHAIDRRGYYQDEKYGLLNFAHLLTGKHRPGDIVRLRVLRDQERRDIDMELLRMMPEDELVDPYMFDRSPRFLMLGGMLFQELTRPFVESGADWQDNAHPNLLYLLANQDDYREGREKLVILTTTVPTPVTIGYESLSALLLLEVNGHKIGKLKDLDEALRHPEAGRHRLVFEGNVPEIFLDAAGAELVNGQLEERGVRPLQRLR